MLTNPNPASRLERQLEFVAELDKLKNILRRSLVGGSGRNENSAEHSWHLALMAFALLEHSVQPGLDRGRVVQLLLVHDIVEIDAGDTYCYDIAGNATKEAREQKAADRIFRLLPDDQAVELRALWDEFESGVTAESRMPRRWTGCRRSCRISKRGASVGASTASPKSKFSKETGRSGK